MAKTPLILREVWKHDLVVNIGLLAVMEKGTASRFIFT
jgi:hypothetical protein